MKFKISLLILFCCSIKANATDYFLSNDGNDNNNGTSQATAWRTLEKLSSELGGPTTFWGNLSSGDRVLFRRGDVFRGTIAFSAFNNQGIEFSAYGSGADPVISGSVLTSNWSVHNGNIWKTNVPNHVYFLFADGERQTLARTPNQDTWNLTSATGNSITCPEISSSNMNFVGSNLCLREFDWRLNRQLINSQSGNTVTWSNSINAANANANFYFDNKFEFLDADGEWFYDETTGELYFYSTSDPNNMAIDASIHLLGIAGNDNRSDNIIQGLKFQHYAEYAIRLMGASNNNLIADCQFENNLNAIYLSGNFCTIQNNDVLNSFLNGMVTPNMVSSSINNNNIENVGIDYGVHRPNFIGDFYSAGIWLINGTNAANISENEIRNCGYIGIRFNAINATIHKNYLENLMLNMDDGGAIYTFGADSHDCTISNNIIRHAIGNHNGTTPGSIVNGIYIDNFAHKMTITENSIEGIVAGAGVLINAGSYENNIIGNLSYKCKQGVCFADWMVGNSVYNNNLINNKFFTNIENGVPILVASDDNNYSVLNTSDNNILSNPFSSFVAEYVWSSPQTFTLAQWSTSQSLDQNSIGSFVAWSPADDNSFIVYNLTNSIQSYNYTNVVDLYNNTVNTLILQPFSSEILIQNNAPLPVTLTALNTYCQDENIQLSWTTASEFNASHYAIQSSRDGYTWNVLGEVLAAGTTNQSTNYNFNAQNFGGLTYFRLVQVDLDGATEIFGPISSNCELENNSMIVFPNPTAENFKVRIETSQSFENATLELVDMIGRVILSQTTDINVGSTLLNFNGADLKAGTYFVRMKGENESFAPVRVVRM